LEGTGIVEKVGLKVTDFHVGDRVFYLQKGCFATRIIIPSGFCVKIPHSMSFEDAATLPCVYYTAAHCLLDVGRIQKGESVLIHSACGGKITIVFRTLFRITILLR
jgi:NADPH:quinone reductase-like Zn-dependent oxidoreductase